MREHNINGVSCKDYTTCTLNLTLTITSSVYVLRPAVAVTQTKTSMYGPRSSAVSGPTSWNSLPQSFRDATATLGRFQRRLKTSLFCSTYGRDLTALHSWLSWAVTVAHYKM